MSLPLATEFNGVVAMALKEWQKGEIYFVHLVDVTTRYCRSAVITNKHRRTIVDKVIEVWIGTGLAASQNS